MQENLYEQGVALIMPYARLVGSDPKEAGDAEERENLRAGIAKLEKVLATSPEHWPTHWLLGKAHEALGLRQEEYRCFRNAFELQPEHPDICRELMRVCLALGKGVEAVEVAEQACRVRPDDPGLMANLGLAMMVAGDVDNALVVVRKALELAPDDEITRALLDGLQAIMAGKAKRPEKWTEDSEL